MRKAADERAAVRKSYTSIFAIAKSRSTKKTQHTQPQYVTRVLREGSVTAGGSLTDTNRLRTQHHARRRYADCVDVERLRVKRCARTFGETRGARGACVMRFRRRACRAVGARPTHGRTVAASAAPIPAQLQQYILCDTSSVTHWQAHVCEWDGRQGEASAPQEPGASSIHS